MEQNQQNRPIEEPKQNKMGVQSEGKLLFSMSVPLVCSMLLQAFYNLVDSIFVSRLGEAPLTALSLSYPIQMLMIAVAVGTGVGMNSLISRRLGERRVAEANQAANNGLLLLLLSAAAFTLFGIFGVRAFFSAYTGDPAIYEAGVTYLSICCTYCLGVFMQVGCERILQAQGMTVASMVMQIIGAGLNIILDPIMIFGLFGCPAMGVAGAAIATVIGQMVSMIACFIVLTVKKYEVAPRFAGFRPSARIIGEIYQVGLPSIIMQAISTVMNLSMNALLIAYTTTAVAVFGVFFKVQSVVFMPLFGVTNASMSIMAFNYGARSKARLMKTWKLTGITALVIMAVGAALFEAFPDAILRLFDASEEMLAIGRVCLRTIAPSFLLAAACITNSTFFQAVGNGFQSMMLSLIRQMFVLVPAAFLLSTIFHSLDAIWWSFPIAEIAAVTVSFLMFRKVYDDKVRVLEMDI